MNITAGAVPKKLLICQLKRDRSNQLSLGFNPFTPTSDQDVVSPFNVNTISSRQVMRIKKNINKGIISWSNTTLKGFKFYM